jgi:hypothetical protein
LTVLLVLGLLPFEPAVGGQTVTPAEFLAAFKKANAASQKAYSQCKVVATVRREEKKGSQVNRVTLITSGERSKLIEVPNADESTGNSEIVVASPDLSFEAHKDKAGRSPSLLFLSPRKGDGFESVKLHIGLETPFCHGPHAFTHIPIMDILAEKNVTIRSVERITRDGRPLVRLTYRRAKVNGKDDQYADNELDFDPQRQYALLSFQVNGVREGKPAWSTHAEIKYGADSPVPQPVSAEFSTALSDGTIVEKRIVNVDLTEFGAVPEEEFSLASAGVTEVSMGPWGGLPRSFYISVCVAVVSMAGLILLRRSRSKPKVAA